MHRYLSQGPCDLLEGSTTWARNLSGRKGGPFNSFPVINVTARETVSVLSWLRGEAAAQNLQGAPKDQKKKKRKRERAAIFLAGGGSVVARITIGYFVVCDSDIVVASVQVLSVDGWHLLQIGCIKVDVVLVVIKALRRTSQGGGGWFRLPTPSFPHFPLSLPLSFSPLPS